YAPSAARSCRDHSEPLLKLPRLAHVKARWIADTRDHSEPLLKLPRPLTRNPLRFRCLGSRFASGPPGRPVRPPDLAGIRGPSLHERRSSRVASIRLGVPLVLQGIRVA